MKLQRFLTEGPLHNIGRCLDIVFAQLEVIPKTRNKFVEIVAGCRALLNYNSGKKIKNQGNSGSEDAFL